MIFAHGSVGFLGALSSRRWWKKTLTKKTTYWLLATAYIGAIFPDIDLFYTALIDGSGTHRTLITHTPFLYIIAGALMWGVLWVFKKKTAAIGALLFNGAAVTHMLADGIKGQVMYFYPFSYSLYGLSDFEVVWLSENLLFINFFLEGILISAFFYVLILTFTKTKNQRIAWSGILIFTFAMGLLALLTLNAHVYHNGEYNSFGDVDRDGIENLFDGDVDGDGEPNLKDLDADGDLKTNVLEMTEHAEKLTGVWYDPSDGGFIQIPIRLGLITNSDVVPVLFNSVGINIRVEMERVLENNPDALPLPQEDSNLDRDQDALLAWLELQGRLETGQALAEGRNQIGDILFMESGHLVVVSGFTNKAEAVVVDVHADRKSAERLLSEVIEYEEAIEARGKMLDAAPLASGE